MFVVFLGVKFKLFKVKIVAWVRYNMIICVLRTDPLRTAYRLPPSP